ncbi:MAG: hypothetical protein ACYS83_06010 [Planctomycetota bacterium]
MPDPLGKRSCETCSFFEPETKGTAKHEVTYGLCHRYAPRPGERQYHAFWPVVGSNHWCGEYFLGRRN